MARESVEKRLQSWKNDPSDVPKPKRRFKDIFAEDFYVFIRRREGTHVLVADDQLVEDSE